LLALADDFSAIVDQAVDAVDGGALDADLAEIDFRRILGTEDRGLDAGVAGVRWLGSPCA
jgi:hypothetical protein